MDYVLKFKNREVARGDFMAMLREADVRSGIAEIRPSRTGWRWNRVLVDLADGYEIEPRQERVD